MLMYLETGNLKFLGHRIIFKLDFEERLVFRSSLRHSASYKRHFNYDFYVFLIMYKHYVTSVGCVTAYFVVLAKQLVLFLKGGSLHSVVASLLCGVEERACCKGMQAFFCIRD